MSERIELRAGLTGDAPTIAALATQVFLDTYATVGVRPDLAHEAFHEYSVQAFAARLAEGRRKFVVAARGAALVGFVEVLCAGRASPGGAVVGAELVRLYIQPRSQRAGLGRLLIREAEQLALLASPSALWLTAWEGNADALAFYRRMGYADVGATTYSFGGNTYGNRVLAMQLPAA